ncbi:probable carbohydrate esterase At4g34215 [Neltuma alba]|uniref:probable carbohydrate esterase At4g34215 n=1 Tax=Neltuma alba TaxID=207710 RepID=UPI0010A45557|nr:probable carbohydrate esterase At4g34215 [Prosopis alba]
MPSLLLWLLGVIIVTEGGSVRPQVEAQKTIFILAGQSNMAGRGGVANVSLPWDGVVPAQCRENPSILRLSAGLDWVEAEEPLHRDIDVTKTDGIGPGMAFANRILKKKPELAVVGLVPCAVGGTNISEWERGRELYNHMMRRAKASVGSGGSISALLWYQGESDTINLTDAQAYGSRLRKFFSDVRADLQSPLLPIVQVALASGIGPYVETVREAQLGMDLLNLRTVDAKGLPLEPDGLHLSSPAQVHLGHMMADELLRFLPTPLPAQAPHPNQALPPQRPSSNFARAILIFLFFPVFL